MKTCAVLRHVAFEDLGTFAGEIIRAGYEIWYLEAGVDDLAPLLEAELTVILGGPIGVYEEEQYPFLTAEVATVRTRLQEQRPTVGICLGAQLIAAALGARVYPGSKGKELGWGPVTGTESGMVLHWHGDTFDLPEGAELLASSALYANQAFRLGKHVLAFQYHPEIDPGQIERWLIGHALEISLTEGVSPVALRRDTQRYGAAASESGRRFFREWLEQQPDGQAG